MNGDEFPGIPFIDSIANGEQFLMLKAMLPYLSLSIQQPFAVYIKFMEMQNLIHFYQNPSEMSACSFPNTQHSAYEMLQDISQYGSPTMQNQFQQIMQVFQMMEMFQSMQSCSSPEDFLGSMLSPEQQEMFQTYQSMFT